MVTAKVKAKVQNVSTRQSVDRGMRLTKGRGYSFTATKGKARQFRGTLLDTVNSGNVRIAIFSVPKDSEVE